VKVLLEVLAALGIVAVILGTAPWWIPLINGAVERWAAWVDRTMQRRGK